MGEGDCRIIDDQELHIIVHRVKPINSLDLLSLEPALVLQWFSVLRLDDFLT